MSNQPTNLREEAREFVNRLLLQATQDGATEIGLVSGADSTRLYQRVAGEEVDLAAPPPQLVNLIVERIKTMADLDVNELENPQEGRVLLSINSREYTMNLKVAPTEDGEQVAMRFV